MSDREQCQLRLSDIRLCLTTPVCRECPVVLTASCSGCSASVCGFGTDFENKTIDLTVPYPNNTEMLTTLHLSVFTPRACVASSQAPMCSSHELTGRAQRYISECIRNCQNGTAIRDQPISFCVVYPDFVEGRHSFSCGNRETSFGTCNAKLSLTGPTSRSCDVSTKLSTGYYRQQERTTQQQMQTHVRAVNVHMEQLKQVFKDLSGPHVNWQSLVYEIGNGLLPETFYEKNVHCDLQELAHIMPNLHSVVTDWLPEQSDILNACVLMAALPPRAAKYNTDKLADGRPTEIFVRLQEMFQVAATVASARVCERNASTSCRCVADCEDMAYCIHKVLSILKYRRGPTWNKSFQDHAVTALRGWSPVILTMRIQPQQGEYDTHSCSALLHNTLLDELLCQGTALLNNEELCRNSSRAIHQTFVSTPVRFADAHSAPPGCRCRIIEPTYPTLPDETYDDVARAVNPHRYCSDTGDEVAIPVTQAQGRGDCPRPRFYTRIMQIFVTHNCACKVLYMVSTRKQTHFFGDGTECLELGVDADVVLGQAKMPPKQYGALQLDRSSLEQTPGFKVCQQRLYAQWHPPMTPSPTQRHIVTHKTVPVFVQSELYTYPVVTTGQTPRFQNSSALSAAATCANQSSANDVNNSSNTARISLTAGCQIVLRKQI